MGRTAKITASTPPLDGLLSSLDRISEPFPKLVVFDLDYTLWPAWVDTHVSPPLKRGDGGKALNRVVDRHNISLSFFPHVPAILLWLRKNQIPVGVASRTSAPEAARQALNGLVFEDVDGNQVRGIGAHYSSSTRISKMLILSSACQTL